MGKEELRKNGSEYKKIDANEQGLTTERWIDILYVSKKEWGWRSVRIENSVDTSIRETEENIKKIKERLIMTSASNNTDNKRTNRTTSARKQKRDEKQLFGYFKRQPSKISLERTWPWLLKGNPKRKNEFLLRNSKIQRHKDNIC